MNDFLVNSGVILDSLDSWAADNGISLAFLQRIRDGLLHGLNLNKSYSEWGSRPSIIFPELQSTPFWDGLRFNWISAVEGGADIIRNEFVQGCEGKSDWDRMESFRTEGGNWSVRYLVCIGRFFEKAKISFPETIKILNEIPGALSCGMTYFSSITPGAHILPHCGFTNAHLRCHLTISTADGCRIRVRDEVQSWRDGKLLIFDDSFEHEVWNDSNETRVILLFDVFHPDLQQEERLALEFLAKLWRRSIMLNGLAGVGS
ncbi:aspartyl/asparaginyl beta-hydroxylase domain-containing protein [Chromobacterium amazonense]|uniref:Aspartyl/asparaginyl beta-hydroxylase domain-containing protein n=1 Tax=Chromobacterium amazonense TaxID=1382803 RepID=A0ABU8V308_9NEIS|nr:aspartyl/asparaginyl beta-hydroxylase domain-containing protein [Chromobacterium amazonense]MDQ4540671.1 aspartyl/asparaginyl beta-hydroxylase domain-containing protein [Chromobacterium amazonense]